MYKNTLQKKGEAVVPVLEGEITNLALSWGVILQLHFPQLLAELIDSCLRAVNLLGPAAGASRAGRPARHLGKEQLFLCAACGRAADQG